MSYLQRPWSGTCQRQGLSRRSEKIHVFSACDAIDGVRERALDLRVKCMDCFVGIRESACAESETLRFVYIWMGSAKPQQGHESASAIELTIYKHHPDDLQTK